MFDEKEYARMEGMSREELIRYIRRLDADFDAKCKKVDQLFDEKRQLQRQAAPHLEKEVQTLRLENEELRAELSRFSTKRGLPGAGRKRKATDREIALVFKLHKAGHSLSEISRLIEVETGVSLSRTTVWNLLNKPFQDSSHGGESPP